MAEESHGTSRDDWIRIGRVVRDVERRRDGPTRNPSPAGSDSFDSTSGFLLGVCDTDIEKGESGDFKLKAGDVGSETVQDGFWLRKVFVRWGKYHGGNDAAIGWVNGRPEVIQTPCDSESGGESQA